MSDDVANNTSPRRKRSRASEALGIASLILAGTALVCVWLVPWSEQSIRLGSCNLIAVVGSAVGMVGKQNIGFDNGGTTETAGAGLALNVAIVLVSGVFWFIEVAFRM